MVTDPAELAHWFPSPQVTLDLRPGGDVTFSGDRAMPEVRTTGRIVAVDPPRLLAFTWGGDELRFQLEPLAGDRTRFTLVDVLKSRDTAARNAAGWEVCLDALTAHAEGRAFEGPHSSPNAPWEIRYEQYLAAGVPSGAPIPGRD
jgi:uncharacterized protein YndB with AHSA1/START domain